MFKSARSCTYGEDIISSKVLKAPNFLSGKFFSNQYSVSFLLNEVCWYISEKLKKKIKFYSNISFEMKYAEKLAIT